jgi:hypothetical protein
MGQMFTENNRPLPKTKYFDHLNDCQPVVLNWIEGDAYCPECGEHGTVYDLKVWLGTSATTHGERVRGCQIH